MINFFNSKNRIQKTGVVPQNSPFWKKINDNRQVRNLSDTEPANPMKILSSQILAMAEQDNKTPTGKKLDIFT